MCHYKIKKQLRDGRNRRGAGNEQITGDINFKMKANREEEKQQQKKKLNFQHLEAAKEEIKNRLSTEISDHNTWDNVSHTIRKIDEETLGKKSSTRREWISDETVCTLRKSK